LFDLVVLVVFSYFLLFVFFVLFFLLFCCFIVDSSTGLCLSGNREINMMMMMMILLFSVGILGQFVPGINL